MKREEKTKEQLAREVTELRLRLARLEEVEAERNRVQEALFETQLRLHYLLSSSPAVIYTCKPSGDYGITFISENVSSQLGHRDREFIQESRFWIDRIHPEDGDRILAELPRLLERGNGAHEYRLLHKDGTYRWIHDEMRLIRDGQGTPMEIIGCWLDLTERKRLEAQLEQARKMEAVATLAAGIAHEFNNALTGIVGNLHLLEQTVSGNDRACHYVKPMKTSALRMAQLTNQLLAYAREGKYQTRTISLSDFVEDTLLVLRHGIHDGIPVETDLPLEVWPVEADPTQLQMVFSAVIANAVEAIEGKGRIRIDIGNEVIGTEVAKPRPDLKPGFYVRLRVEDDGKGMDEQTKARMFEPFFSTKFHGRGLGMAAVYGIVKNHNGWIGVDSELGKGTVVRIYLPAATGQRSAAEDTSS